ncbi:lysylphosphatidylglycerol synthase transmembrane domain-containing protein [Streptomyces sp. NPDC026672]|uniref:lysylphosphatidylglycerol synthase transmembrane domain-containing protein n=1 Tax=unclassified Streptomyces TaxID=2593676 RepID=UPI0033D4AC3C
MSSLSPVSPPEPDAPPSPLTAPGADTSPSPLATARADVPLPPPLAAACPEGALAAPLAAVCGDASLSPLGTPRSPASFMTTRSARLALCLAPLLLVLAWGLVNRPLMYEGAAQLVAADPGWLLAGVGFTAVGFVAASCVRQGALPDRLPPGLLLASQFAAGAANHVLPAGLGAHAVTLRFMRRQGVTLERATASLALYSLVKPIAKTAVLVVFLATTPAGRRLGELVPDGRTLVLVLAAAGTVLTVAGVLLTVVRSLRRPVTSLLRTALADARHLHTRPARVLALWGGAAAMPLIQACTVASVGAALGLPVSWAEVVLAFLAAGTAVGAVPAPGGLAVDAALVVALVTFGAPLAGATATVIGFRVLTDWLPLLPGALVLSALIRTKAL